MGYVEKPFLGYLQKYSMEMAKKKFGNTSNTDK
jgi:hypothetical protein